MERSDRIVQKPRLSGKYSSARVNRLGVVTEAEPANGATTVSAPGFPQLGKFFPVVLLRSTTVALSLAREALITLRAHYLPNT